MANENVAGYERHISVVGIALILAILAWAGNSILEQGKAQVKGQAVVAGKLGVMTLQISHLRESLSNAVLDRYTATDANRDYANFYRTIKAMDDRISHLENVHHGKGRTHEN